MLANNQESIPPLVSANAPNEWMNDAVVVAVDGPKTKKPIQPSYMLNYSHQLNQIKFKKIWFQQPFKWLFDKNWKPPETKSSTTFTPYATPTAGTAITTTYKKKKKKQQKCSRTSARLYIVVHCTGWLRQLYHDLILEIFVGIHPKLLKLQGGHGASPKVEHCEHAAADVVLGVLLCTCDSQ